MRTSCRKNCTARNISHLCEAEQPDNLKERFAEVDGEANPSIRFSRRITTSFLPMQGPFPFIGGKNRAARAIIDAFPPHSTYLEVFSGGAQLLFRKEPSRVEVLNDLDGDIVNFFRVCQQHYEELVRCLRFTLVSRTLFSLFEKQNPETLTDIQRAVRFFYLQKNAFAGLVRDRHYHYCVLKPSNFNPGRVPELLEKAHQRLQRVQIENLPYQQILTRYDRPTSLFYCDPPYYDRDFYNFNFHEKDFVELAERLGNIRGKFVLSLNDVPEVRRIFGKFHVKEIAFVYTARKAAGKRYRELLIANYPLPKGQSEVTP
jgi:DNA adenine methylase